MTSRQILKAIAVGVLGISLLAAGAAPAHAAFPGQNGKIAFETSRLGNTDIFDMNPDGSDPSALTNDPALDRSPVWSPDGKKIAFQSRRNGNFDIFVMNADGTGLYPLTSEAVNELQPTWSPDSARIAYAKFDPALGSHDIWVKNADGSGDAVNLTDDPANDLLPAWSPDGASIAFQSNRDGNHEIYRMDPDGSNLLNLTLEPFAEDTDPAWFPDGTRIVFVSDREVFATRLYAMNADGNLLELVLGSEPGDRDPGSSPDGTAVVFSSTRTGSDEIYKMNLDGTGLEALTIDGAVNRNPDWQPIPDAQGNGDDQNQPPVANAGADGEAACASGDGANVRLDGSGSGDTDSTAGTNDDIAVFEWFTGFGTDDQNPLGTGPVVEASLPAGTHVVTLRVTDAAGEFDTDEAIWVVVDPEPPQISVTVDPSVLWPANHRMVDVRATVVVTGGLCSPAPSFVLESVTSNEPDDAPGEGDGRTRDDIADADCGSPDVEFNLRAERMGRGRGRVYTVTYAIVDGAEAGTTASAHVVVPHDGGNRSQGKLGIKGDSTRRAAGLEPPPRRHK